MKISNGRTFTAETSHLVLRYLPLNMASTAWSYSFRNGKGPISVKDIRKAALLMRIGQTFMLDRRLTLPSGCEFAVKGLINDKWAVIGTLYLDEAKLTPVEE